MDKPNQGKPIMPELLAPAGNIECMEAAVNMGCDAVYLGGKDFSARARADNFTLDEIGYALDYCHLRGVKVFIAVNTLYKDSEMRPLMSYLGDLYEKGADAFIMQDLGAAKLAKENFPSIPLHASTQMTANSLHDVLFLRHAGFRRVVLSRELSFKEIEKITSAGTGMEIEVFIHGALCVCYSGQCLMSSLIGGRSGNRGSCAQPCRQRYGLLKDGTDLEQGYLLSPRDLMALDWIEPLQKAGVASFKIEGRMRGPEYVAQAVKSCARAIRGESGEEDKQNLLKIFNRGGYSTAGYLDGQPGREMMSHVSPKATGVYIGRVVRQRGGKNTCRIRLEAGAQAIPGDGVEIWPASGGEHFGAYINKPPEKGILDLDAKGPVMPGDEAYKTYDKKLNDDIRGEMRQDTRKLQLEAVVSAKKGKPMTLRLSKGEVRLDFEGPVPHEAVNRPVTADEIRTRLSKTGGTTFQLKFIKEETEPDIFIGIGELNQFRRDALEAFRREYLDSFKRCKVHLELPVYVNTKAKEQKISALIRSAGQLEAAAAMDPDRIYMEYPHTYQPDELAGRFAALPRIDRESPERLISRLEKTDIAGYLVRTWGQVYCLRHSKKQIALDYSLHIYNKHSRNLLKDFSSSQCLSPELNHLEAEGLLGEGSEIIVYGYLPAMVTAQCPAGNFAGGRKGKHCRERGLAGKYYLRDKTGAEFPIMRDCESCLAYILHNRPVHIAQGLSEARRAGAEFIRLEFSIESKEETEAVCKCLN